MRASVVLPEPGGPHRMNEKSSFLSIATRSGFPLPVRWSWPTNSSSVFGLIFDANGSIKRLYSFRPVIHYCAFASMRYRSVYMNGKTILVGVVVIIIVAVGGYFAYKNYAGTGAPAATDTGTPAEGGQVQAQD